MNKKQFIKKGQQYKARYTDELAKQITLFVEDCKGKTDEQIKELYKWYEGNWHKFANSMNMKHKAVEGMMVMGFTDAFEASMMNAYRELPNMSELPAPELAHYKRVFNLFRRRNFLQRCFYALFSSN